MDRISRFDRADCFLIRGIFVISLDRVIERRKLFIGIVALKRSIDVEYLRINDLVGSVSCSPELIVSVRNIVTHTEEREAVLIVVHGLAIIIGLAVCVIGLGDKVMTLVDCSESLLDTADAGVYSMHFKSFNSVGKSLCILLIKVL